MDFVRPAGFGLSGLAAGMGCRTEYCREAVQNITGRRIGFPANPVCRRHFGFFAQYGGRGLAAAQGAACLPPADA